MVQSLIQVGVNRYDRIEGLEKITSGWLDSCIAVACYRLDKSPCFPAHLQNTRDPILTEFLDAALKEFDNRGDIQVFICGSHVWANASEGLVAYTENQRHHLLQVLKEKGFDPGQIKIQWGKINHISKLTVDASDMRPEYIQKEQQR